MNTHKYNTGSGIVSVIRSVGERTALACRSMLEREVATDRIEFICEHPFEKALRRTYEFGIDSGAEWLLSIDGDVLLRTGAIGKFVDYADTLSDDVFQVQPLILDKFLGGYRKAGIRLYRIAKLPQAIGLVPEPGEHYRPEMYTVEAMGKRGHRTVSLDLVVGIHDYEQYYRDIYRKCFVHGHKHTEWLHKAVPTWKRAAHEDLDYWVALQGFWAGLMSREGVRLDIDYFPNSVEEMLSQVDAEEKQPLQEEEIDCSHVENVIIHSSPQPFRLSRGERLRELRNRIGLARTVAWGIGWSLTRVGRSIQTYSENSRPFLIR